VTANESHISAITARVAAVRQTIDQATARAGRAPASVRLVAVSKLVAVESVVAARDAGCSDFGENYVQELVDKARAIADASLVWHHIGHLQTNKVRQLVGLAHVLHGVDRVKLVAEIERRWDRPIDVLIQVNVSGEASKSGCSPEALAELVTSIQDTRHLRLRGLMTIPPLAADPEASRSFYRRLRQLRDEHGGSAVLPELSMGMSHDFAVAIEEGATLVRVGTAIFGPRPG
jgi:pyridoxal phosphate enzyme (YggS family)